VRERAVFVAQAEGEAIDLGFSDEVNGCAAATEEAIACFDTKAFEDALVPTAHVVFVVCVVDAEHRDGVFDGAEAVDLASHACSGGVWVVQIGVLAFERCEFGEEAVKLRVGHDGGRVGVVGAVGLVQQGAEFVNALGVGSHGAKVGVKAGQSRTRCGSGKSL
jgi:hypothetical protein